MSKSLRNYPDVREVFDRDGADAMRWFLMSSPILRGGNLVVTEQGIRDSVRQVLIPLWNSWYFFQLYANAAAAGRGTTRRWRTDSQRPAGPVPAGQVPRLRRGDDDAARRVRRRGRVRLDPGVPRRADQLVHPSLAGPVLGATTPDAFDTLYTVLEVVCRVDRAAAAAGDRGGLARADRRALGAPGRLAGRRRAARRRRAGRRRWTWCARSARRRRRCARPATCATGCRSSTLTVVVDDPAALAGFEAIVPTRSTSRTSGCSRPTRPRRRRTASSSGSPSTPARPARGSARTCSSRSRARSPATGRWPRTAPSPAGGLALEEGEYSLETVAGSADGGTATGVLRRRRLRGARHRGDARAGRRGPGPRPGPRGAAGAPRRRPRRLRPDRADRRRARRRRAGRGPRPTRR